MLKETMESNMHINQKKYNLCVYLPDFSKVFALLTYSLTQ